MYSPQKTNSALITSLILLGSLFTVILIYVPISWITIYLVRDNSISAILWCLALTMVIELLCLTVIVSFIIAITIAAHSIYSVVHNRVSQEIV